MLQRLIPLTCMLLAAWPQAGRALPTEPPRVVLLPPRGPGVAPAPVRARLETALREEGAEIVPSGELRAAARELGVPSTKLATPGNAERAAERLQADALVEVEVARRPKSEEPPAPFEARMRVIGPDGSVRLESRLPLAGRTPTPEEARTLAELTVEAARPPPTPTTRAELVGPPAPEDFALPPPPVPGEEVAPSAAAPKSRPSANLSVFPSFTWRNSNVTPALPLAPLQFSSGTPYLGIGLDGELFPLPGRLGRVLGLGLAYSYSTLNVDITGAHGVTTEQSASEHRATADAIGRWPSGLWGGELQLRVGAAFEGFYTAPAGSLVSSTHLSPRLLASYAHPLVAGIEVQAAGGIRPWAHPGDDLTRTLGASDGSFGTEAALAISGGLPKALPAALRWSAGYNYLRYDDDYGPTSGVPFDESYHRLFIGLGWRQR